MKQKSLLTLFCLVLLVMSCTAQLKQSNCKNGGYVVIAISNNDCANCQYLLQPAIDNLRKNNCNINFVVSGVPPRLTTEYVRNKDLKVLSTDTIFNYKYLDTSVVKWDGIRSAVIVANGKDAKTFRLEEYIAQAITPVRPAILYSDSVNITAYWGASASELYLDTSTKFFIYNDIRSTLYIFDDIRQQPKTTYSLSGLAKKWNDTLVNFNYELDAEEIKLSDVELKKSAFGGTKIGRPYITNRFIYLPLTKFFIKKNFIEDSITAMVPYSYFLRISKQFDVSDIYFFPVKVLNQSKNLFNSLGYSEFLDDTTFMMNTSSMNRDSLIALYILSDRSLSLKNIVNLKYPSYFEKVSKQNGYPMIYPVAHTTINKRDKFFFHLDDKIYSSNGKSLETESLPFLDCSYGGDTCYVESIIQWDKSIVSLVTHKNTSHIALSNNGKVLSKIIIPKLLHAVGIRDDIFYTYEFTDEKTTLHLFKLNR